MKVKANGISMNYEITGKGANLVLINGAGDNLNMWYNQVPVFSKSYRVITYDVRGSGKTEIPDGEYGISVFTEDAYQLMKAIGVDGAYFLGYSMGGRIALELTLSHPELVKALILANGSVGLTPPTPEALERRQVPVEFLGRGDIKSAAEIMTADAFSPDFKSKNPAVFRKYMEVKQQSKAEGIARLMRSLSKPIAPPDLSKVKCPVLIIVGENDILVQPAQGKEAHEIITGSKLVLLPTGHAAAIESPEEFNSAVLEFLAGLNG
jgi:3-oxoadipate enol-lactonase